MIKVAIIDDYPLLRKGLEAVLDTETDIQVVSKASNGNDLFTNIRSEVPDIVILDLTLPNESGLDLLKQVKLQFSGLSVLVLSVHPAKRYAIRCLKNGASGYLNKASAIDELVEAIRYIVNKKKKYISKSLAGQLADNIAIGKEKPLHEKLSDREFTVLCMIATAENIKSIADKLLLSPHTIQTYRSRIKEKMQLSSNVEMARYAIEHNLV